ncbi:MAG: TonB-dependent receptor, partial [Bryobacteraceae bacterium]|nr:TonB-dependent receptor [Bryobacteraceae bacterium]
MTSGCRQLCFTAILAFSLLQTVVAQTERGTIRGTVVDPAGASITGAKVTARNVQTGVLTTTVSTNAGVYSIPNLRPGTYAVEAEQTGFKKLIRNNVVVEVAGVIGLDLALQVGDLAESVTVSSEAPQLQSESSEVRTTVSPQAYIDLPVSASGSRSTEAFIFLAPGTTGNTFDAHVNGSQTLSKEIQIEGLSMTTAEVGGDPRVLTLPPDAIQEFSLATSSYSAEFGNTGGGVERFVIRSGTNQFHGAGYEYLRNDKLDARGFFNATRSVNRQNEYGGSIGGPIWIPKLYNGRNRSFFFFNINYFKFRSGPVNQTASVPTAAFRRGDLSALRDAQGNLIQIYDPATTRADNQGGFTRDPFPNNQIPTSRFSAVSQKVLGFVPLPTLAGIVNNYPATGNNRNDNRNNTMKFDHLFNSTHRMSGSWNYGKNTDSGPFAALPRPVANSRDGVLGPGQNTVRLSHDWVISPTVLNHFAAGLTRQHQLLQAPEQGQNWGQQLGLSGVENGPFPVIFTDPFTPWGQNQDLLRTISATWAYSDSLSVVKGKHNLKFGVDFRKLQNNLLQGAQSGSFTFSRNETAFPSAARRAETGNAFASFLLGEVDAGSIQINEVTRGMRLTYLAGYVQDDFKVSRKLTLNLGLRWDLYTPMREVNDVYSIMDATTPNPAADGRLGALIFAGEGQGRSGQSRLTDGTSYTNFGPRLGFAYSITSRIVMRSAWGLVYYPTGALGGGNAKPPATGFIANPSFFSQNQGVSSAFRWDNGFPSFPRPPFINAGFGVGPGLTGGTNTWNTGARNPSRTQTFNYGLQWQLGAGLMLDTSYVGSKSTRLATGVFNLNQVDPVYLRLGELLTQNIDSPAVAAAGFRRPYASFQGSLAQSLRPFPQYGGIGTVNSANVGNSSYHSLQVKLDKRLSNGFFFLSSYTWGKSLTDASSALSGFFSTSARDHYNRSLEKALSVFDVPHRLVGAFTYELPIGPGKPIGNVNGAVGKVIGGWQLTGVLSYQSGTPIGVGVNNTLPLFNSRNLPNTVAGVDPTFSKKDFDPARNVLLNAAAFQSPAAFTFGNAGSVLPNARTFNTYNEDFGILKRTRFTESINLELRFEMFNAFNRVIFGGPAS